MEHQDGVARDDAMARFQVVLRPRQPAEADRLIEDLEPLLEHLGAHVDQRAHGHLIATVPPGADGLPLQLYADVQRRADGPHVELVLMSPEPMVRGATRTRERFAQLLEVIEATLPELQLVFRSDRDGPVADLTGRK